MWDKKRLEESEKTFAAWYCWAWLAGNPKKKQKNGLQWSEVPQFSLHNSPRHGAWSQPQPHSPGLGSGPRRLSSCLRGALFATLAPRCCARCHGAAELDGDVGGGSWYTYTGDTGCLEIDSMGWKVLKIFAGISWDWDLIDWDGGYGQNLWIYQFWWDEHQENQLVWGALGTRVLTHSQIWMGLKR